MQLSSTLARLASAVVLSIPASQSFADSAGPIRVTFQVNISQAYDYVLRTYVPIQPITSTGSFTFSTDDTRVQDYGTTTIVEFFGLTRPFGTTWTSPVTALIPQDPASGSYGPFYNAYTFPNVSDYPSTFFEQVAAQSNTYIQQGDVYSAYHIELRATRRSDPRSGIGLDDYAFDRKSTIAFLQGFIGQSGQEVYFNESFEVYSFIGGQPIYQAGKSYSDYSVRILDVSVVPEVSTQLLFASGMFGLAVALRRKAKLSPLTPGDA